jgi:signal transduction histidine kinase/ligand-binding sensor domain-containing protein
LRSSRITSLHCDTEDALWIGHETGELTRLVHGQFQSVSLPTNWPGGAIEGIAQSGSQDFWLLGDKGYVLRLRDGLQFEVPGGASASRKAALARGHDDRIWVCANGRVAAIENDRTVEQRFDDPEGGIFVERILPAREGGLWVCAGGSIRRWHQGRWVATATPSSAGSAAVNALLETRSGMLVAGTLNNGVYILAPGGKSVHLNRDQGLSHDWVRALCEDHEGNLWVGSGGGVDTLRTRKVTMVNPPDQFRGRVLLSVTRSAKGEAWIGTEGAGLYRFFQNQWSRFDETAGLSNAFVWSVLETRQKELLVGTWGGGLQRLRGDRFESSPEFARITSPVVAMFQARDGTVWMGTTTGLYSYQKGSVRQIAGKDELSFPDIRAIAEAADGTLWFGMLGGGLGRIKEGRVTQIRKDQGLSSDFIQALLAEPDGTLWIGTSDNGLCRLKAGRFSSISLAQGLPTEVVTHLVDDGNGQLWIGSNRGIFRGTKADLNRCADGELPGVAFFSFGKSEGLTSPICSGGFQPGAAMTPEGSLWFPTAKGLATLDPANAQANPVPPRVVIEELLLEGKPCDWRRRENELGAEAPANRLRIRPGIQQFEFRYTAPSFTAATKVRFRRRLEGLENNWVEAKTERTVSYSYLPPGDYTFRVTACNNDGVWNERGAALAFTVLPAFYQTWWFHSLTVLTGTGAVGAAAYWISRRRLRQRLEQLERQRALERERARIARDIHDDLGASLTRIILLSQSVGTELDDPAQARIDADQIYQTARDLTRAMDEIVWAVNPKHDTLDSLVTYLGRFAQSFLSAAGIRCRLDAPMDFPPTSVTAEVRHNVFLAFKEALNNVIKHASATEVRVLLELLPKRFTLTLTDNGCGFQLAGDADQPAPNAEPARSVSGNGLANMHRRLEEIGGLCQVITAPGEGTRVQFSIPLKPQ